MSSTEIVGAFFEACETGKGWDGCAQYCEVNATFSCQFEALADTHTLEAYAEWMKGLLGPIPDGHYELKGFAYDKENDVVLAFAVFHGTHSAAGGPIEPTGNSVAADLCVRYEF